MTGKLRPRDCEEIKQQKATLSQLDKSFEAIQSSLTDAEKVSFQERMKIYGEVAAMRWLVQQHGNPQSGP